MINAAFLGTVSKPAAAGGGGSSFVATGAGDSAFNGTYTQAGTHNGQPYYSNGARIIYYVSNTWYMYNGAPGGGPPAYTKSGTTPSNIPGAWSMAAGTSPAPTVT